MAAALNSERTLADVHYAGGHDAAVQGLEAKLGAAGRQRLDDA
jgi:hypothetical protein